MSLGSGYSADGGSRLTFAIFVICCASLTFSMMLACVKLLGDGYSPFQVLLMRYVFGLGLSLPLLWREGADLWRTPKPMGHAVRALYGLASTFAIFFAVTRMEIATVTAISFAMPLFLVFLSMPMLGERVGPWRSEVGS